MNQDILILWDYMQLQQSPVQADCIVGFGCYNEDIPRMAARLYHQGFAPRVLFTGGLGRNTAAMWTDSEAYRFSRIAIAEGVPESDILLEDKSTNTAENILFTRALLEEQGISVRQLLGVHKPYMQRRIYSAWQVYAPDIPFCVTSWPQSFEQYCSTAQNRGRSREDTINMIVGDFQRIDLYAKKGYQIPQTIPDRVWQAYHRLVAAGYTKQLAK